MSTESLWYECMDQTVHGRLDCRCQKQKIPSMRQDGKQHVESRLFCSICGCCGKRGGGTWIETTVTEKTRNEPTIIKTIRGP
jgi:hypothetical protein